MKYGVIILIGVLLIGFVPARAQSTDKWERAIKYFESENYTEALPLFTELAEDGQSKVLYYLGLTYVKMEELKKAEYWLRLAAKQEYGPAQYEVARLSLWFDHNGSGKGEAAFERWMRKAAANDDKHALSQMGLIELCNNNYEAANNYLTKAIEYGVKGKMDDDYVYYFQASPQDLKMLCDFLINHPEYTLYHHNFGNIIPDCKIESTTRDVTIVVINDTIVSICEKDGKVGVIKIDKTGNVVGMQDIPFVYEWLYPNIYLFNGTYKITPIKDIWFNTSEGDIIDINGKKIEVDINGYPIAG